MNSPASPSSLLPTLAPFLFVLIWSTGWITGGFVAQVGEPLWFLVVRYCGAIVALSLLGVIGRAQWPDRTAILHCLLAGMLLHGAYLAGVWWAIAKGIPAGVSAVIAALQPILTALLAPMIVGERISRMQWLGILFGFIGIALVLVPKLAAVPVGQLQGVAVPLIVNVIGMVAITLGTFYQKRFLTGGDVRTTSVWQFVGALILIAPISLLTETQTIHWSPKAVVTLVWAIFALSIAAIFLLLYLIRHGEVSRAAAYIYLVPPTAALMAYFFFGETLQPIQLAGMVVTAVGVYLATRK